MQTVARANKIVCQGDVIGGVRDQAVPTVVASTAFRRAHRAQLQTMATVPPQHADARKITGIMSARRSKRTGSAARKRATNNLDRISEAGRYQRM